MESVLEILEKRADSTDDELFHKLLREVRDNSELYGREFGEPTLKHGTDTINFDSILTQGLTPGEENQAEPGESSESDKVCFSTSYPIALRYAELTEANNYIHETDLGEVNIGALQSPMVTEIPASVFDGLMVDDSNEEEINEILGANLNPNQKYCVRDYCTGNSVNGVLSSTINFSQDGLLARVDEGDEEAQIVTSSLLNGEEVKPEYLMKYGFFEHFNHNELEASFLNEISAYEGPREEMVLYVPQAELEDRRQRADELNSDPKVGSLEGRALVHEERMREVYMRKGCISYTEPTGRVNVLSSPQDEEKIPYERTLDTIHISRLGGIPILE